jgi:hypothetical protein
MDRFLIGLILVASLSLSGCSKQPEGNAKDKASTADAEKDDGLSVEIAGVDVELEKGKGLEVKGPDTDVKVSKDGVDVHAPNVDIESQRKKID